MLAYEPRLPIGYDFATTLLSVLAGVVITGVGWDFALRRQGHWGTFGGAVIGAGVGTMHYVGMGALEVAGRLVWDPALVIASGVLGISLSACAVRAFNRSTKGGTLVASLLLTTAICSLHFVGMAAVVIIPDPRLAVPVEAIGSNSLAAIVLAATLLILLVGLGVILFDRRITKLKLAEAEQRAALADEIIRGAAERDELTAKLQREAEISSAALAHMAQGLSMYDEQDRLIICNERYSELYGIPGDQLPEGTRFVEVIGSLVRQGIIKGEAEEYVQQVKAAGETVHIELVLSDGSVIDIQRRQLPGGGWIATHEDVTQERAARERISYLASHDTLTGLPNRAAFLSSLDSAIQAANAGRGSLAVITIDLDRFKEVNDTLGHPAGDEILRQAATRLRNAVSKIDVVTRLGGDEFAVLQGSVQQRADAVDLARRILGCLSEPFHFDGHTVLIGASVGISVSPEQSADRDELLKMSDLALYRAKAESRGTYRFFEEGMDSQLRERRQIEADLLEAIREAQFEVHYQPLLNVDAGTIECFEALVRWRHPTRGLIQPSDFISIAEDTGLIIPIGEWVLRQACRDAAAWPSDVKVAVNLSPAQFKRGDLVAVTLNALTAAGLDPARLELEITESVLLHDEVWVRTLLNQLVALGVHIAMDDFGTGYSSLSYLRSFPFTKLKIDRSFIEDLAEGSDSLSIVQATIQLSQKLGLQTTAEGVESADQLRILTAEGCTHAQGYHVSRPIPIAEVAELLTLYNDLSPAVRKAS
jgi:diguanylate cyclase (GGDEF)-like protein